MKKLTCLCTLALVALLSACGGSSTSKGAKYCDCLIENDCWDYRLCPNPGDCYDIYATEHGSWTACFSVSGSCEAAHCSEFGY